MRSEKVLLSDTGSFSSFFLDYILRSESLKPYYSRFPELANFKDQIADKYKFPQSHRDKLVTALTRQYTHLAPTGEVLENIKALASPNTFTVTTGHQLNIFTGPLYFIYKIVTTINACRKLSVENPGKRFVPVYWMASEDHDFVEISTAKIFGQKYSWQTTQQGAVGRFDPSGLKDVLSQINTDVSIFRDAYLNHSTLSDAVRSYVHALFQQEGLVVVDADDKSLKELFKPVIRDDLFVQSTHKIVERCNASLISSGHEPQVNPREINLFYLDKGLRSRIELQADGFAVTGSDIRFSKAEAEQLLESKPENFSPNVLLRPLYQETILPNLAYIGGPAELVYWLQLKDLFDFFGIPFPILLPRNFAMVMDAPTQRKFAKIGLEYADIFLEKHALFNRWVRKHSSHDLSLVEDTQKLTDLFMSLKGRGSAIDKTLGAYVDATATRTREKFLEMEKKFVRAEKRLHSDRLRQIEAIKDTLFPGGSLQERTDNFLNFYSQDRSFIQELLRHFDPFDFRFNVLFYDES